MHIRTPARRRLLDRLNSGSTLTVLHAPSGSGKTTLLRNWTQELTTTGRPVLWVNLTPGTRRTQQVRDAVSAAVTETGVLEGLPGKRAETLRVLGDEMPAREALGTLFTTVPGLVLVIDGGEHVTEDPEVMWSELLTLAANHPGARVVLSTRWLHGQRPELLTLDPRIDLLDAEALAMSPAEIAEVVAATAAEDPLHDPGRLAEQTQGHPRTVVAALVAAGLGPTAPHEWQRLVRAHTVVDLDRIDVRRVLEPTALSPVTDVALAARLSGGEEEDVRSALLRAEVNGYGSWREAADGTQVFEMSSAAREALAGAPTSDPEALVDWLVARDELGDALEVALRTRQLERATSLYRRLLVTRPFDFTATFDTTLRTVPRDDLLTHPMLAVSRGVALLRSPATQHEAGPYLEPIARRDPRDVHEATADDELMDLTAQSVVLGVLGRPGPSAAAAVEAARRLERPDFAAEVDPRILTPLACILSQSLADAGHLDHAQRLVSHAVAVAPPELVHHCALYGRAWFGLDGRMRQAADMDARVGEGTDLPGAAAAGVTWGPRTRAVDGLGAGLLLLDRWDLDGAAAKVATDESFRWDPGHVWREWVRLHVAMGRGAHGTAVRALATVLEEAGPQQPSLGASALANAVAVAWLTTGHVSRARRALAAATSHPGQTSPARLLLELASAGPEAALHLATRVRDEDGHSVRSRAAVETVAAAAALRTGGEQLATQLLGDAATLWAEHGCRAHLLYLPAADHAALRSLAARGPVVGRHYLAGLDLVTDLPGTEPAVTLSTRERAVLEALAAHRSRADVAHALHVSENTVKSQLRSVYRKLGVNERSAAITRAMELDLLRPDGARAL